MSQIQAEKPSLVINISVEFVSLKRIEKHGSNEQNTVINCQGLGDMNGEMPFLQQRKSMSSTLCSKYLISLL